MPEGKFCNRRPIKTEEELKALLGDKGGQQYYKEMETLEVDTVALWDTLQKTCKSRTRTWLEICAHCGLCANSCFLYTAIPSRFRLIRSSPRSAKCFAVRGRSIPSS